MIPFDTAEKKVTAGAWFHISLNYLLPASNKHHKEVPKNIYSPLQSRKMDRKWILVTLLLYQIASGADVELTAQESKSVDISCQPAQASTIVWFRVVDKGGMELIASSTSAGLRKPGANFSQIYSEAKLHRHTLTLKSFNTERDSGIYSCGSFQKGTELVFGKSTRLVGVKTKVTTRAPPSRPPSRDLPASTTPCICKDNSGSSSRSMFFCAPLILAPLAGGCGLVLLLLVVTILYCNRMRTRRCPHHYKRKMRMMAPEKQMMTNRHI